MRKMSVQMQMYVAIAVIVIVAAAVLLLLILPLFKQASALGGDIAAEQQSLATAQALLARRQSAKAQSAASEVELMSIANAIPDSPQLPSVIIELQDIANASDVVFVSLTPADITQPTAGVDGTVPAYSVVPMSANLSGTWPQLIDFVRRVHLLDRSVRITNSTFTYVSATADEVAYVDAIVALEVYVMAGAATAPGGTAATTAP